MNARLETKVLSSETAFDELRPVWNTLLDETPEATPWQSIEFASAWWRHLRGTRELRVVVVERDGRPCLLLPLQLGDVVMLSVRLRVLEPIGMPDDINRPSFALGRPDADALDAAMRALWSRHSEWDLLRIDERSPDAADVKALSRLASEHRLLFRTTPLHPCPSLTVSGSWEDYLQSRGQRLRKNLRASRRQLESVGPLRLEEIVAPDRIDTAFDVALDVFSKSWKQAAALGLAQSDAYRRFTREVLNAMAKQNRARILILWSGTCPVAATIAFTRGDTYYSAHIAHDEAHARASPGTLLESLELEGLFRSARYKTYDFLGAALANKRRWTDTLRPTWRVLVMRPSLRVRLIDAWYFRLKPAVRRLRGHSAT
jgi:CelD/BcsL family acetyltransferase involved in cellulose biosynthesis